MKVKIYSATWKCSGRRKATEFFDKRGIEYREYDLANDRGAVEKLMKKTSLLGSLKKLPVIEIEGTVIHGFDLDKIKTALKRNGFK